MSTEEAEQSTALMDEMCSRRIEGCFNVALTGALMISELADWYRSVTLEVGTMAERFLIEPKSDGKPDPVIRLNIITGAADGDGDGAAAHSSNEFNSSREKFDSETGSKMIDGPVDWNGTGADVVGAAIESDDKVTAIKVSVRRSWSILNAYLSEELRNRRQEESG
jgi:hypothetical protein